MPQFTKKPVTIEAVQFTAENEHDLLTFMGKHGRILFIDKQPKVIIETLEGKFAGDLGDWIIKGIAGEFYSCKDAIFRATYDPADEAGAAMLAAAGVALADELNAQEENEEETE